MLAPKPEPHAQKLDSAWRVTALQCPKHNLPLYSLCTLPAGKIVATRCEKCPDSPFLPMSNTQAQAREF